MRIPSLKPEKPCASPPLFVVSPHLDDAVFSCAALLAAHAGARVCTVFAGTPADKRRTPWDRAAGYDDSTQAMRGRWREDDRALECCGAQPLRLDFLDGQYGPLPDVDALTEALNVEFGLARGSTLVVPLGVHHPDHVRVGEAWVALLRAGLVASCIVYEDAIHRAAPGAVAKRLAALGATGLHATSLDDTWSPERLGARAQALRLDGIGAYESQLRAFGAGFPADLARPERYWRVART